MVRKEGAFGKSAVLPERPVRGKRGEYPYQRSRWEHVCWIPRSLQAANDQPWEMPPKAILVEK